MKKILLVGNRLDFSKTKVNVATLEEHKDLILKSAKDQLNAGAKYLNIRVGSFTEDALILTWLVKEIQANLDNTPLFLDSTNQDVLEAGLRVYNRTKDKPFINSADYGSREKFLDLAAKYQAKIVCVCMKDQVPMDETERFNYCTHMLESGLRLELSPNDMYFDPVLVPIIEEQDRIIEVLNTIKQINGLGLNTICNIPYVSLGMHDEIKPFIDSAFINMAMLNGLTAAILDPTVLLLNANILSGECILNERLFSQAEFDHIIEGLRNRVK